MLSGGMTDGGIGVGASPSQDGSTIDDKVTRADQPPSDGDQHGEDEEGLWRRRSGDLPALALLGGTGNARLPIVPYWQATGQCKRGPVCQPVVHILVGEPPQRTQERQEQERLLAIRTRHAPW